MAKNDAVQEVAKAAKVTVREVRLADLKPYENNPRIIEKAVPLVAESIRQTGYITPIVVDEEGVVLAGHTRLAALLSLGETSAEVLVAEGLTEEQKAKYRILDNKTGELATWDNVKLSRELAEVDFDGFDFGQPVKASDFAETEREPQPVLCPRCGEVVAWN